MQAESLLSMLLADLEFSPTISEEATNATNSVDRKKTKYLPRVSLLQKGLWLPKLYLEIL